MDAHQEKKRKWAYRLDTGRNSEFLWPMNVLMNVDELYCTVRTGELSLA